VQPALERALRFDASGDADEILVSASPRPAWATPPPKQDEHGDEDGLATRDLSADVADLVRTPESNANILENPRRSRSVAAAAERFHSFAAPAVDAPAGLANDDRGGIDVTHPKLHFELEVTRRREREARDAIDKMDRAVSTMRDAKPTREATPRRHERRWWR
jgi:hypothetical protein